MPVSLINPEQSERIKKRCYIADEDEYNCSSEALNSMVMSAIVDAMPLSQAHRKPLKQGYVADLIREGGISPSALLVGMIYIRRLVLINKDYLATVSPRDLFLVAMIVASKYMNDEGEMEALTNSDWSCIGSTPKATVDQLERDFLKAIGWRLYVPLQEFYSFLSSAEGRIAMEQAHRRGWLTYTELTAIWESSSSLHLSMLKHVTKVAVSSASLYLVCVYTLLAATSSLPLLSHSATDPATPPNTLTATQDPSCPVLNTSGQACLPAVHHISANSIADAIMNGKEAWPGGGGGVASPPEHTHSPHWINHFVSTDGRQYWEKKNLLNPDLLNPDLLNSDLSISPQNISLVPSLGIIQPSPGESQLEKRKTFSKTNLKTLTHQHHHSCSFHGNQSPVQVTPPSPPVAIATLEAKDLSYQHKGTFHWDPLINASSHYNGNMSDVLTLIVDYLAM